MSSVVDTWECPSSPETVATSAPPEIIGNLPFLKIPSIQARVQDAKDWRARFQTVRDTFSSRVGQISNAALARSVIAYNENSQAEERQQAREEVETLAILTGLEIDSAKNGSQARPVPLPGQDPQRGGISSSPTSI